MTKRTGKQQAAIEVYCREMTKLLNDAGYTQRKVLQLLNEAFDVPVTQESFKDIFRELGHIMFGCESTADLDTTQVQQVYQVIDQKFSETTGVSCAWPSRFAPLLEEHEV